MESIFQVSLQRDGNDHCVKGFVEVNKHRIYWAELLRTILLELPKEEHHIRSGSGLEGDALTE